MRSSLSEMVRKEALRLGADLLGIAPVSRWDGAPEMLRPQAHLPEAKSVVVMAVHHPDASVEWGGEPNSNYPGPFQIGMIPKLDSMSLRVARFLERRGHACVPMPCTFYWRHRPYKSVTYPHAASFSHMNAFVAAGLGEYGWHGMVMSPKYGPRQRIISVVTAAELEPDPLYSGAPLCDRCGLCEKACYGENYKKEHLFSPPTISFDIEGKHFEYANVNRWRCFWGEQCHLDMNRLAEEKDLTEEKIYAAMDRDVNRVLVGAAGYMCASFKHCMSKPVRRWDRASSPGPKRKKEVSPRPAEEIVKSVVELARVVGMDRIAIQPLSKFESLKKNFHAGFRTEQLFSTHEWVISIGRAVPESFSLETPLFQKNMTAALPMIANPLMSGVMDISRHLDDLGHEALMAWDATGVSALAAKMAGWPDSPRALVMSVICKAPLKETLMSIPGRLDACPAEGFAEHVLKSSPEIDILAAGSMDNLEFEDGVALKRLIPEGRSLIAVGVELPRRVVELAGAQEAECAMSFQFVSYQAQREAFWAAHDIANALTAKGHFAVPLVDLAPSSASRVSQHVQLTDMRAQSPFAAAAGAGSIGKSGLLVTDKFGPRQRFAFVVTSAKLETANTADIRKSPCPEGCAACASACPVSALDANEAVVWKISKGREYPVFERSEEKCQWARVLGMEEGEGAGLPGWRVPKIPIPEKLDEASKKAALEQKDPIQRHCYLNPNHSDTQVERCLQACPLGKEE